MFLSDGELRGYMVKSPKTGRELKGQRVYHGPRCVSKFVRKYFGPSSSEDE